MNLANWQQTSTVSLVASDGEAEQEYRLTFGTCSNFDIGMYSQRRRKVFELMRTTYGDDWIGKDEAMVLQGIMIAHAVFLAGLKKVEAKDGETWTETKLPDSWYDAQRFATDVPAGMIDTLTEAVIDAGNPPRLFSYLPAGDEEKKALRLTVVPSAS